MRKFVLVLMLFALTGCVDFPAKYQPMGTEVRPARPLASVEVFQTQRPTRPYRELGVVTYRAGTDETLLDAIAKIKVKAAEVGADAVIMLGTTGSASMMIAGNIATLHDFSAMAIAYTD
jgi:hypothetical protein